MQGVAECAEHAHLLSGILVFFGVGLRVVLDHSFDVLWEGVEVGNVGGKGVEYGSMSVQTSKQLRY